MREERRKEVDIEPCSPPVPLSIIQHTAPTERTCLERGGCVCTASVDGVCANGGMNEPLFPYSAPHTQWVQDVLVGTEQTKIVPQQVN